MKNSLIFFFLFLSMAIFSQKDSLQIGDRYWEDQLYLNVTFNTLTNQPNKIDKNTFSFGFSAGYIKDIPLVKSSKMAIGIGLGYAIDSFNLNVEAVKEYSDNLHLNYMITANKLKTHTLEIPIQFRLRTSTQNSFSFWRLYTGINFSYNLSNTFSYTDDTIKAVDVLNSASYNKFQTGLTLSSGYKTFNFHVYYGLTPLLKNAFSNGGRVRSNIVRFGLAFYLL